MTTSPSEVCIYPLSPTYLPLHRYLYYITLLLSVLYPRPPPLIKGCFAYALTYSSTAAFYSFLLVLLPSSNPIINLDIFALWAILSTAGILLLPLLTWSSSLRRDARPIIRLWGILITVGAVSSMTLLSRAKDAAGGFVAAGNETGITTATCQAIDVPTRRLRNPETAETADYERVFGYLFGLMYYKLSPVVHICLFFGALSGFVSPSPSRSSASNTSTFASDSSSTSSSRPKLAFLGTAFRSLRTLILYLTPCLLISVLVINEIYLLKDWPTALPEAEKMYEIGQWGLYAGVALVSVAAGINHAVRGEDEDEDENRDEGTKGGVLGSSRRNQGRRRKNNWGWGGDHGSVA